MTRDEIYDHLAQVYLGKREGSENTTKKNKFNAWLLINILITVIIFSSAFYGLTAFFTHNDSYLQEHVIYSLYRGAVTMDYRFADDTPPVKSFSIATPGLDASDFGSLKFSIRAKEEGTPGIVKVSVKNQLGEEASFYVQGINYKWQDYEIPFYEFSKITDWTSLTDVSFVLEAWNVDKRKGLILIDNIEFSS